MKKFKKSTGLTVALLIYVSATAAYFLPRNTEISNTEKYVTVIVRMSLYLCCGWCFVKKKSYSGNVVKRIGQNKNNYSLKNRNKMKRLALLVCLLIGTMAAHAQFEKGNGS